MNVIAPRTLRAFWEQHPQAKAPLKRWQKIMQAGRFEDLHQLRELFPHADLTSSSDGTPIVIFNVGGNDYRLVATVIFQWQTVYVKHILTHAEYDHWNQVGRPL